MRTVLIAEDSIEWANILKRWIDQVAEKYSLSIAVEMVLSEAEAIDQMRDRVFDLIITDMSPDLQLIRLVREINAQSSIIALKSDPSITAEQSREAVTKWQVSALLVKQTMDAEAFSEAVVKALGVDTPHRTVDAIKQHISRLTDLTAIFDTLAGLIGADAISIHQYDQKQGQFILPGHVVGLKYPFAEDRPTQDSPAGRIIQTRRPYFAEDAAVDQLVSSDLVKRESITSVAALPLLINNEAVGILFAYFRVLHRFKEREREFLVAVAELTANAIKDTRDRERKAEVHSALSAARDITDPKALAKAVIQAAQQFAELGDVASVRDALTLAQFITDPVQQTNALVIVVDTLAQLRDTRGLGSVIEIALTITIPDAQAQVLRAASRAFEKLGETEKAQHVASLITQAFTYDIFLSYSHSDSERVRNWLLPRLENAGLRVCIDFRDFEVGVPSLINVERAIERSRTTLLVLTREYIQSEWANLERSLAILLDTSTREQRVIPVLLGRTELPPLLRRLQFIDLSQPDEADAAFEQLISTIRGEKPGREYEQIRNPFVYSPVAARSFVDREIELQKVLSSVERGQSISIVGPRRIGKTSFLRTISQQLQLRENIVWLYIDLEMLSSEEQFYQILGSELERIVAQYSKRDQEWSVLTIDGILRSVARQKKIVLLMDEFDVVTQWYREGRFSDQFFGALRSWANSGQITMIVASVKNLFELSVGSQYASSFANIFLDIHLGKFDRDSARRLATLDGTVHFTDGEVDFIVDTTGGHPFYIQMLCSLLLDAKNANQGQADLQSVKEEFLERIKQFRDFEGEK